MDNDFILEVHANQSHDNCFIDSGDIVKIFLKDGKEYTAEVSEIGIRVQHDKDYDGVRSYISVTPIVNEGEPNMPFIMLCLDDIQNIEIVKLKTS